MKTEKYNKVSTIAEIKNDPRIERFVEHYDGTGRHMAECKDGFRFESCSSTMEVGTVKQLCDEINNRLHPTTPSHSEDTETTPTKCTCNNIGESENCDKNCDWHEATNSDAPETTENTDEVKRYNLYYDGGANDGVVECKDGDYVMYSDYSQLQSDNEAKDKLLKQIRFELNNDGHISETTFNEIKSATNG